MENKIAPKDLVKERRNKGTVAFTEFLQCALSSEKRNYALLNKHLQKTNRYINNIGYRIRGYYDWRNFVVSLG